MSISLRDTSVRAPLSEVEHVFADISDPESLSRVLKGREFDCVFNAVGYIDHSTYMESGRGVIDTHYVGILNLLQNVWWDGLQKFVQIGSSDEYGNTPAPQIETHREAPISPYSAAKVGATHLIQALCRTENFPGVVTRLFLVYGPGQKNDRFLPQIIGECLEKKSFATSPGKQLRDFCYIDDVVEGLLLAAVKPDTVGKVINIASGQPISIKDVIEKVVKMVGSGRPDIGAYPYRRGENMELYADIGLARSLLDWRPATPFERGLKITIENYSESVSGGKQ